MEEDYSPYCKICSACGEDGCCPATVCQHHKDGLYCEGYIDELKFGYEMYKDIYELAQKQDPKKLNEIFDKNWDLIFKNR